jgi:hypothetical protein
MHLLVVSAQSKLTLSKAGCNTQLVPAQSRVAVGGPFASSRGVSSVLRCLPLSGHLHSNTGCASNKPAAKLFKALLSRPRLHTCQLASCTGVQGAVHQPHQKLPGGLNQHPTPLTSARGLAPAAAAVDDAAGMLLLQPPQGPPPQIEYCKMPTTHSPVSYAASHVCGATLATCAGHVCLFLCVTGAHQPTTCAGQLAKDTT